jgi:signal transduction histidine kinase/ligand-binding sensor domain-containing protein
MTDPMTVRAVGAIALEITLAASISAAAVGPSLSNYVHDRWALRDGFRVFPVQALAQTPDGYLWIGTPEGLWRFDGVRFVQWRPLPGNPDLPNPDVRALSATGDGALWIATASGIRSLRAGRLMPPQAGAGAGRILALLAEANGTVWTVGGDGQRSILSRIETERTTTFDVAAGSAINSIFRDRGGTLWLASQRGLFRWSSNGFAAVPQVGGQVNSISESPAGELLIASSIPGYLHRFRAGKLEPLTAPHHAVPARVVLADREGNVWAGTFSQGLVRINGRTVEQFSRAEGLSGTVVETLLEDRDGGIWVGTNSGLDHFRSPVIGRLSSSVGLSEDFVTVVCAARDGGGWVATPASGIDRIDADGNIHKGTVRGLPSDSVISLYQAPTGVLFSGTLKGVVSSANGRNAAPVRTTDGDELTRASVITGDASGRIWIADGQKGLYEVVHGRASKVVANGLPSQTDIYSLLAPGNGQLWIGYHHGAIVVVSGGSTRRHEAAPGPVLSLFQAPDGDIWAGTGEGLSRYRNGKWTTWTGVHGVPAPVYDILSDRGKSLWLNTHQGLARLDSAELARQPDGLPSTLTLRSFGIPSGMRPQTNAVWAKPRSALVASGNLWFATEEGLAVIDPIRAGSRTGFAQLMIEQVTVDGAPLDMAGTIAFRGSQVQFDFTVVDLNAPDSAHFRYRLYGFDGNWVDAQNRRQAVYTNLSPGRYRFEVSASNAESAWAATPAAIDITVLPASYQNPWFQAGTAILAATALFVLYLLRIQQLAHRLRFGEEQRLAERTRIARDLHDTLLQTIVGVSLQLDAFAFRLPSGLEEQRTEIDEVRRQIDATLGEARHSVWALRIPPSGLELISTLEMVSKTIVTKSDIRLEFEVSGKPLPLPPTVAENLLGIARAAVTNAVLHSKGTLIRIAIAFQPKAVRLSIADNGQGMSAETLAGGCPGHFGLSGMRERASNIHAQIAILSKPRAGTSVEVIAPIAGPGGDEGFLERWRSTFHWLMVRIKRTSSGLS